MNRYARPALLLAFLAAPAAAQTLPAPDPAWELRVERTRAEFLAAARRGGGVVRAADFGMRPGADASGALRRALEAAAARRARAVLLPAGTFPVTGGVALPSGVSLIGEGCGRTTLVRPAADRGQLMLRLDGARGVRVQGISFDFNHAGEFYRAVGFRGRGSEDVQVLDNCFFDSRPNTSGADRWAVELTVQQGPSRRVWISGNTVRDWIQLTAGSGAGILTLRVTYNRVEHAEQNAIGISQLGRGSVLRDVVVARNTILNPHGIGIFIGPDQPSARQGTIEGVLVAQNRVEGFPRKYGYGVFIRAAEASTSDIVVRDNVIVGTGAEEAFGIRLLDDHGGRRRITRALIHGNHIVGCSRGVWLEAVYGGEVRGNRVRGGRPFVIEPRAQVRMGENTVSARAGG